MQVFRFNDPPAADASHGGTVDESTGNTSSTSDDSAPADLPGAKPSTSSQTNDQVATSMQELLQPSTSLLVGPAAGSGLMMQGNMQQQAAKEYSGAASAAASAVLTVAVGMAAAVWSTMI
jgi:hypothetical protein